MSSDHLKYTEIPGDVVFLRPAEMAPAYIRRYGEDWVAVRIADANLGSFMIVLPPEGAAHLAHGLTHTLEHLGEYRAAMADDDEDQS